MEQNDEQYLDHQDWKQLVIKKKSKKRTKTNKQKSRV